MSNKKKRFTKGAARVLALILAFLMVSGLIATILVFFFH